MNSENIAEMINDLIPNTPRAVMMTGSNPLAATCPERGIYPVSSWACTTKHISYKTYPEGWSALVEAEERGEDIRFITIWEDGKGWCISLDDDCYLPLVTPPKAECVEELADYLADACGGW
jgi:hypothetical protein